MPFLSLTDILMFFGHLQNKQLLLQVQNERLRDENQLTEKGDNTKATRFLRCDA